MLKKDKDKNKANTEISPDLFLTVVKINFDKAAKGFEHLSAWCTAALYLYKMPDDILSNNDFIANLTAEDYNKLAAMSLILNSEDKLSESVNDIITAMNSLKLVSSMSLNKGDNNGKK